MILEATTTSLSTIILEIILNLKLATTMGVKSVIESAPRTYGMRETKLLFIPEKVNSEKKTIDKVCKHPCQ